MKRALLSLVLGALLVGAAPSGAAAADPPTTLWQSCEGTFNSDDAGQCSLPRGIAADPTTGRLYVADQINRRIVELTAWGEFVKAWGWGVDDGSPELQTCTAASGCQASPAGTGTGQFGNFGPQGVTIDSNGDVYAVDVSNRRVQKFDPTAGPEEDEAQFLLSFGEAGTGNGQFGASEIGSFIDVGPSDKVYVGDVGRVQVFDSAGNHLENLPLPGETVQSLAVDSGGGLYLTLCNPSASCLSELANQTKPFVLKLNAAGTEVCKASVADPRALATDPAGNVYVASGNKNHPAGTQVTVRQFTSGCAEVPDFAFTDGFDLSTGIAVNTVTEAGGVGLYVSNSFSSNSFVRAYFPPPDKPAPFDQPPPAPPTLADQYAVAAGSEEGVVQAEINPHFWADTRYRVEYGTAPCSGGGCESKPLAPGTLLGAGVIDEVAKTAKVTLSGLEPATTYHYRFVVQSSGGGPTVGPDATFTTFPAPDSSKACPNDAVRLGAAAKLSNCRAYEMVSPLDKGGGEVETLEGLPLFGLGADDFNKYFRSRLNQAAPAGEAITYSAARAFAGAISSPWSSQYLAQRTPGGWETESLNHPLGETNLAGARNQETPFKGLSEDLCSMWLIQDSDLVLTPGAPEGVPNLYRRQNCGAAKGAQELLTTVPAPGYGIETEPEGVEYVPQPQGHTPEGCSIFRANAALTPDADPLKGRYQLYEHCPGEQLRLLSVLPDGAAAAAHASLGTAMAFPAGNFREDSVATAVAAGGERLFWTADSSGGNDTGTQLGTIYLRANPTAEPSASGACDEAGKACSLQISPPGSFFWGADPAGTRIVYQTGDQLFEAEIEEAAGVLSATSNLIAGGARGVLGSGADATRVYFTSTEALAPGATPGVPNLYLHEEGSGLELVATLSPEDSKPAQGLVPDSFRAAFRSSRVSPDGEHLAFVSEASLTGYDNSDASSGVPSKEVFLYDAGEGELRCVSCNPSGVRPDARAVRRTGTEGKILVYAAAELRGWESQMQPSRTLSADGSKLFFESYDALLLGDTNGMRDVYEWSEAQSQAECDQIGATLYVDSAGGCLSLISSGESPQDSEFIDASADGRDVFFTTTESLYPPDPGLVDLYDAREGGGFAVPSPPASCQGEACQPPAVPPSDPTPSSSAFLGAGNVNEAKGRKPCAKPKVKRKGRCVAKKQKKRRANGKAGKARRAQR